MNDDRLCSRTCARGESDRSAYRINALYQACNAAALPVFAVLLLLLGQILLLDSDDLCGIRCSACRVGIKLYQNAIAHRQISKRYGGGLAEILLARCNALEGRFRRDLHLPLIPGVCLYRERVAIYRGD